MTLSLSAFVRRAGDYAQRPHDVQLADGGLGEALLHGVGRRAVQPLQLIRLRRRPPRQPGVDSAGLTPAALAMSLSESPKPRRQAMTPRLRPSVSLYQ
jgi:hypothetical protein